MAVTGYGVTGNGVCQDGCSAEPDANRIRGIRAAQQGRHSNLGPQPGQETVAVAAFLIARADIDVLLGRVDELTAELEEVKAERFKTEIALTEQTMRTALWKHFYEDEIKQHGSLKQRIKDLETERKGLMDIVDRVHSRA